MSERTHDIDLEQPAMLLAKQTGITQDQARELVLPPGVNWSSLVPEAQLLKLASR